MEGNTKIPTKGIYIIDGTEEREALFKEIEQLVIETVNRELRKQSS